MFGAVHERLSGEDVDMIISADTIVVRKGGVLMVVDDEDKALTV